MRRAMSFRIPQTVASDLEAAARELGMSQADLVAAAVTTWIALRRERLALSLVEPVRRAGGSTQRGVVTEEV